jgi:hypothetical protein
MRPLQNSDNTVIPVYTLKGTGTGIQKSLNLLDVACASEDADFRRNDRND